MYGWQLIESHVKNLKPPKSLDFGGFFICGVYCGFKRHFGSLMDKSELNFSSGILFYTCRKVSAVF